MAPRTRVIIDTDPVTIPYPPPRPTPPPRLHPTPLPRHCPNQAYNSQGVDDILALLLAFSASEGEIEVLLISVVFGNVDVQLY